MNNFFIFPGMSFAAVCCEASKITEHLFLEAAEAVANSLDQAWAKRFKAVSRRFRVENVAFSGVFMRFRAVFCSKTAGSEAVWSSGGHGGRLGAALHEPDPRGGAERGDCGGHGGSKGGFLGVVRGVRG